MKAINRLLGLFVIVMITAASAFPLFGAAGDLDAVFDTGASATDGANNNVYAVSAQSDGKYVVGGLFTKYDNVDRSRIARVNADGSLDTSFAPGSGANDLVQSLLVQADGKIVVGGKFSSFAGVSIGRLVRLTAAGAMDAGFNAGGSGIGDGIVEQILQLASGKLLVMGSFSTFNGVPVPCVIRLNADGSLDGTFNAGSGPNGTVSDAVELADGDLVIVGQFTSVSGTTMYRAARLNADGSLDTASFPNPIINGAINAIELDENGKLVIGGSFYRIGASIYRKLARLNDDGSVDGTFDDLVINSDVNVIGIQPDGKLVIGGVFTTINSGAHTRVARVLPTGALDPDFSTGTGANNRIRALAMGAQGTIVFGGDFTSYNGTARNRLLRLENDLELPATVVVSAPTGSTDEDSSVDLGGVSISDVTGEITVTLAASNGSATFVSSGLAVLTADVSVINTALAGGIRYVPSADYFGSDTVTVTVAGSALSAQGTISLTVNAVNDAPTISLSQNAFEHPAVSPGSQTVPNFATFSTGPANESGQTLVDYTVNSSNTELFPGGSIDIADNGTLTYTPATGVNGSATITVTAQDDGGTANGGADTSAVATFVIAVGPTSVPPTFELNPSAANLGNRGG